MSVVLTKSRFINALRCYFGYALNRLGSALFHSPFSIHHSPIFISVEPANICQLRCPECPVGRGENHQSPITNHQSPITNHQSPMMPLEVFRRVLAECRETASVIQFYFQGEPLLNKDLPQMIREAHEAGLYTIVSTNSQAMTLELAEALVQSGLDRIIISMDGLSEASYNAYRIGGSLEKTKSALQYLRAAKNQSPITNHQSPITNHQSPIIELQVLRLRSNEHEWRAFKQQYKLFGADRLVFKTAQLYDYQNGHPLMPTNPKYSRYILGKDGKYHRRKLRKGCFRVWSGAVITTNGDVLPCCYDKSHAYAYGNIMEKPLRELFTNDKALAFRQAAFRHTPQICQECWK